MKLNLDIGEREMHRRDRIEGLAPAAVWQYGCMGSHSMGAPTHAVGGITESPPRGKRTLQEDQHTLSPETPESHANNVIVSPLRLPQS